MPIRHFMLVLSALALSAVLGPAAIRTAQAQPALPTQIQIVSTSASPQSQVPVTWGQVFAPGAVPAGSSLTASIDGTSVPLQVDVKARHADGSIRHAILSASVPMLPANARLPLGLSLGAAAGGSVPSAAALLMTPFDAQVSLTIGGTVYSTSAREALANPGSPWLSGLLVSDWTMAARSGVPEGQATWDQVMARTVKPDYEPSPPFDIPPREPSVPQPPRRCPPNCASASGW